LLTPPAGTPQGAGIALVLLDDIAGPASERTLIPMRRLADSRWEAQFRLPAGSLIRYHYRRLSPTPADEASVWGEAVPYRLAFLPGPAQVEDVAAGWTDSAFAGETGHIVGHLRDASTGAPLPEMLVCAGGVTAYTDGEGFFRLEGLPPGLHTLVAISPDGSYQPFQQGAVIAAGSATPAELDLIPAPLVEVAFQVTVPENTPMGMPVRIAGNLPQLGNSFVELPGGLWSSGAGLPSLAQVDESHYVFLADLPAGTDLRYRYTLGDGRWNAEADAQGTPVIRELIVPGQDTLVQDLAVSWGPSTFAPVTFRVTVPENTSASDGVSLQLNPSTWLEPLPMTGLGPNDWSFVLYPPADVGTTLHYRYCRDRLCGSAGDADSDGGDSPGRALTLGPAPQEVQDAVRAWQWWGADLSPAAVASAEIAPRARFEAGVEWLPLDELAWRLLPPQALADVASLGANALTLSPAWVMAQNSPLPVLGFDPAYGPTRSSLFETIHRARELGLQVGLHPMLLPRHGELSAWWADAPLDEDWWQVWFESYRSFVVTYASLARDAGAEELILGGPEVALALPGGQRPDGQPAWVPVDNEIRWRELIAEVRSRYQGRLAFEIELGQTLQPLPPFLDAVDEVHIYWHAPLGSGIAPTSADMRVAAATLLDSVLADPGLAGKPIVLSVEYLSVDGGAAGCIPAAEGGCAPAASFDFGGLPAPGLAVDTSEQAQAINAILAEVAARPGVVGFFVRRYNPMAALQDLSASVSGKPAWDVLWYWYPRMLRP
jgi:hypothetical protein